MNEGHVDGFEPQATLSSRIDPFCTETGRHPPAFIQ